MFRRTLILFLLVIASCAAPSASAPTVTPLPTQLVLPTLPPVGATILPSDRGNARPTLAASDEAQAATPSPTNIPIPTPSASGFEYALRPQFAGDLDREVNETIYTMNWDFNADLSEIKATQRVIFANRTGKSLEQVYFRLFANYPDSAASIQIESVTLRGGQRVQTALEADETALRVELDRPLAPDELLILRLAYTVQIPADNPVRYGDFTRTDWITTLPTIYPILPAYDAQGWHLEVPPPYGDLVYADSSIYDVTITTPSQFNVIASGQLVQETTQGARTTRHFIGAPMRDFDVNVTNALTKTSAQVDDVTINSYYLPAHAEQGKRALDWTVNAFKVFEDRFGAYPFKELDLVETPTSAGGIEYPGVITVASKLYEDPAQLNFFEFATVHETAHQWFYSTVGNDQVNHPWLDEALTQYASLVYFEDRYGKAAARNIQENFFDAQYAAAKDKFGDRPAGLPVSAYDEDAYGAFVYAKGPKFFQAVRDQIGGDAFFSALRTYYRDFKFRIAQPQDLIKAFNKASGQDVTALFQKWIGG